MSMSDPGADQILKIRALLKKHNDMPSLDIKEQIIAHYSQGFLRADLASDEKAKLFELFSEDLDP